MKCKTVVGRRTLIPAQDVHPEVAELVLGLIRCRHRDAKIVAVE